MYINPQNTIFGINRLIGRKYEDKEVQEQMKFWPFKIIKDEESSKPKIQVTYKKEVKQYFIENILSIILQEFKKYANNYLKKEVKDVVIIVPTYFKIKHKEEIRDAVSLSGLNILSLLNSSTAAGLTYAYENSQDTEENIIFDLGSGTLNLSLISFEDGLVEVRSVEGNIRFYYSYCSILLRRISKKNWIRYKK